MALSIAPSLNIVLLALALVCLGFTIRGFVMLYHQRTWFRKLVKDHSLQGATPSDHSFIFGNLIAMGRAASKHPVDISGHTLMQALAMDHPHLTEAGAFYLDLWPISYPVLVVVKPELIAQFTQETSLPKHAIVKDEFECFSQCKDLVTTDGSYWKKWRSIYNPGFSAQNIQMLVPGFVEEALILKKHFQDVARTGKKIKIEDQVTLATCDVIGRAVLGKSLGVQTSKPAFFKSMKINLGWIAATWEPHFWARLLHPMRRISLWYNNRVMFNELAPMIEDQLRNDGHIEGPKTVNALAIRAYKKEFGTDARPGSKLERNFIDTTIQHMKIFLFAGHDTTSSILCYTYYRLHKNPEALAKLRAEHDAVLGPDPSAAADLISATPAILNQLPYTTGVLKETLRLSPPASTVRQNKQKDEFYLVHPKTRQQLPTTGFMIMSSSFMVQRDPEFWPQPTAFIPERWLAREGEPLHPVKNTWRPFELGPRSCIGQEVAMTELRLLLALTIRDLDIIPAYEKGAPTFLGDEAYQQEVPMNLVPHPKDGLPARIKLRKHVPGA